MGIEVIVLRLLSTLKNFWIVSLDFKFKKKKAIEVIVNVNYCRILRVFLSIDLEKFQRKSDRMGIEVITNFLS